jgi:hypothetical protein
VGDPGAALGEVADRLKGTRTILQGLGVGVRVGREYVLLDRDTYPRDGGSAGRSRTASPAYAEASRWLSQRGFSVAPSTLEETAVAAGLPEGTLDHVAFAADDLQAAIAAAREKPLAATEDAARFKLRSGLIVEIVRDTDRPDVYWCPMHPDVRAPTEGTCARCGMALVAIAPPRIGEYKLDVTTLPRPGGGTSGFRFSVRDPETGDLVSRLIDMHERPFHLFVVSRDLSQFAHEHPLPQPDGSFELRHGLDPGEYILFADFLPAGGTPQLVHRAIVTPGYLGTLFARPASLAPTASEQVVSGLRITLEAAELKPLREATLRFQIADDASGAHVTDLEPYLGASGHLLIVRQDATAAIHAHPSGTPTKGPHVSFGAVFPTPGRYKLWVQVQRQNRVVTAAFVIDVP